MNSSTTAPTRIFSAGRSSKHGAVQVSLLLSLIAAALSLGAASVAAVAIYFQHKEITKTDEGIEALRSQVEQLKERLNAAQAISVQNTTPQAVAPQQPEVNPPADPAVHQLPNQEPIGENKAVDASADITISVVVSLCVQLDAMTHRPSPALANPRTPGYPLAPIAQLSLELDGLLGALIATDERLHSRIATELQRAMLLEWKDGEAQMAFRQKYTSLLRAAIAAAARGAYAAGILYDKAERAEDPSLCERWRASKERHNKRVMQLLEHLSQNSAAGVEVPYRLAPTLTVINATTWSLMNSAAKSYIAKHLESLSVEPFASIEPFLQQLRPEMVVELRLMLSAFGPVYGGPSSF